MCTVYSKWYDDTVFAVAVTPELGVRLNSSDSLEGSCQAGVSKSDDMAVFGSLLVDTAPCG